jgi:endonuclease YncB( thermonuclease family)
MAIRAKGQGWQFLALVVAALAVWGIERWKPEWLRGLRDRPAAGAGATAVVGGYERIDGCTWVDDRGNDGDSFRLKLPDGRVETFRLYFADCPESAFRTYGGGRNNHERIHGQARDFGMTDAEVVEVGKEAKRRVETMLSGAAITIFTEWDDPFGDRRYHAFVETPDGGWLHEWLVGEGLARVHTKGAMPPGGAPAAAQKAKLEDLEREARR